MMNLVEVQRENEALKLKLFWREHSYEIMENAMRWANASEIGPKCSCSACKVSGRYVFTETEPCIFKPWFEQVIRKLDMSIGRGFQKKPLWNVWFGGSVFDSRRAQVVDDGYHFSMGHQPDWCRWTYGSKLWKATSVGDPELAKLDRLLNYLNMIGEYV